MKRHILLYILLGVISLVAGAQTLTVKAPSSVPAGENFRLEYTVNTANVSGSLQIGSIPEALEIIFGPSISRQESFRTVNGHTSGSSSITYTYTLIGNKNGTYTIPPARINVGDKTITSNSIKISISGNSKRSSNRGGNNFYNEDEHRSHPRSAGSQITDKDLFIRVSANKTRVHEQEPILLTYKVYTLVDLTQLQGKMPELNGFHSQEIPLPQQKSFHIENVGGRNYRCVTWSQYVMYPQMTGSLEIPSITFKGVVVQENRNVDPYEAFFNGGSGYIEVKRDIKAPGLKVQVDPLPERPANFSGGVGKFNVTAQLDKTEMKAGDPLSLRVVVSGTGNLKLMKQPNVEFPKDFEKYDAKVTDKTRLTSNGVEGNMVYDFLAVPRNVGEYVIPAVELVYYDTSANAYKTVKTQPFNVKVLKGDGSSSVVSDFSDVKNKDIRPIKEGRVKTHGAEDFFYQSKWYWVCILFPLLLFVALLIIFRKRAVDRANIVKMRGKKANKIATKRLKKANALMKKGQQNEFYDEVLRALWGYVGDKMNMPVEELSRDNITERLEEKGVDEATISTFIGALDECEYERYAPGDAAGNMDRTFNSAMTAIMKIEETMKGRKRKGGVQPGKVVGCLLLFAFSMSPMSMSAVTKANADAEYAKGNYQQAIKDYEELLKKGISAELYYNLGNAYYRTDNITRAIINYERARMLSPGDADIRFNLQLARSKTIDKITPESEMFFVTWYKSIVNLTSVDRWARTAIISIILTLMCVLLYLFAERIVLRKVGFFGAIAFLVLFILANVFAWQQKRQFVHRNAAIVVSPSVQVKATPDAAAKNSFVLHEGTRIEITDNTLLEWKGIRLDDGREGWIAAKQIEVI